MRTARGPLHKSDRLFDFFGSSCDKSSTEPLLPMFFLLMTRVRPKIKS